MIIGPGMKGFPADMPEMSLREARTKGWQLHKDIVPPFAVLRRSALENNDAWMARFINAMPDVVLCPHGKTTMAPQLFDRQLRSGAWGITCATMAHLRSYRRFGVPRVLFANQIVSEADARWLAIELCEDPGFDVAVFVDSPAGADLLAAAATEVGLDRPIPLLLEIGVGSARTGVRSPESALDLARHIAVRDGVALAGIATFEGVLPGGTDEAMEPHVASLFDLVEEVSVRIGGEGLFRSGAPVILSAGGSRFFDMAASRLQAIDPGNDKLVVLRSGCYISHDAHHYEVAFQRLLQRRGAAPVEGRLENALQVWASVQSRPEEAWAFANIGKRDISHDIDLPVVLSGWRDGRAFDAARDAGIRVDRLSDQHAHLALPPAADLRFGDHLAFGISHPCTTFDKWRFLYEVDDEDRVVDIIATFF
ncbi:alanine racemase [Sphingopyxis kveilinensis]|uniref:alanine racemase n=1 Tax=Sphingopyxis kveilinensis TaxID=3114367 RepID=UPI003BB154E2